VQTSAVRARLTAALVAFLWSEWAQLGVSAARDVESPWAQDPEALLLMTLEVARADPRLFDEVLDWAVENESALSVRRLRALCVDDADRRLVDALLGYIARYRPRARLKQARAGAKPSDAVLLFPEGPPVRVPDPSFREQGFLKEEAGPTGKSQSPDPFLGIAFAFRLRGFLGVGARAEVVRTLLTTPDRMSSVLTISQSAGYAKRNVQEALSGLERAGLVSVSTGGTAPTYGLDRGRWAALLGMPERSLPEYRDWPHVFGSLRTILRWLETAEEATWSDYMHASRLLDLVEGVGEDLREAGVVARPARTAADAGREFDELVAGSTRLLRVG
jgi:hypothetical protein